MSTTRKITDGIFNFLQKASCFSHEVLAGRCAAISQDSGPSARTGGWPGGSGSLGCFQVEETVLPRTGRQRSPHCQGEALRSINPTRGRAL